MRDQESIARIWYNKAEAAGDPYDRFVCLWFAFNALYNEFLQGSERNAIGELIYSNRYNFSNTEIKDILKTPYAEFFKQRIIRDCRGSGRDTSESAAVSKSSDSSQKKKLNHLLRILYQVRCNLFHGNKLFGRDSDDQVVSNAAHALAGIMNAFLKFGSVSDN